MLRSRRPRSSWFNLIGGDQRPDAGLIRFRGEDVTALAPHERCRGIGRSYQIPHPFDGMTVFDPGWGILAGHLACLAVLLVRPRGLFPRTRG